MPPAFPLIQAQGSPRMLGRLHGEQARAQVHGFLDYLSRMLRLDRKQLQERALRFQPLFERQAPHLVEEVHGLAEGAGVPFADALAVQVRGELGQVPEGACTTFVISGRQTAAGQVLIGQNSDIEPEHDAFAYVLMLRPDDRPAVLMWTFGGQLGYHGLNARGVAHFANSLGGGPTWRMGLPHYPVKRLMLEQGTLAEVEAVLRRAPVCSSGNYVLCDGTGAIADVELTPEGFERFPDDGTGFLAHSNHFLCSAWAPPREDPANLPDSFPRLERMRRLLAGHAGRLTVDDCKRFLADHEGQPTSICRHPHAGPDHPMVSRRGRTTASLIAEPARGRLHVSRGNPCEAAYTVYSL